MSDTDAPTDAPTDATAPPARPLIQLLDQTDAGADDGCCGGGSCGI